MDTNYICKIFRTARRCLMLPYNEKQAINRAFNECSRAFSMIENNDFNENIQKQIVKLKIYINERSKDFNDEEKSEICNIINDLASNFSKKM